jgi:hypothetical protein
MLIIHQHLVKENSMVLNEYIMFFILLATQVNSLQTLVLKFLRICALLLFKNQNERNRAYY